MKIKINRFIPVLILTILVFIAGCWDYKEIDGQIIISGAAIDYDQENKEILLTAEIALPTSAGKESAFNSKIYQGKGQNILEAIVDLRSKAGRNLLWSHSKVLILSKEFMKKEKIFIGVMDWIKRNREMRDTVWLILSKEKTAGEILLKSNAQTEKIISYYLEYLFLTTKSETFLNVPYSKFIDDLQSVSGSVALPTVSLEDSGNGKLPFINGTAIINRTKPIGWLDGKQTRILLLLKNELKQAVFVPEPSAKEKVRAVSLKMTNCQTSIKPVLRQKGLIMEIQVKMEAEIGEIDGEQDIFKPDKIKKLAKGAQSMITDQINQLLQLLKESYQSDVIGFGNKVEAKYPKLWRKMENNWRNEYAKIASEIHLKLTISGSAQSMKVTKVGQ